MTLRGERRNAHLALVISGSQLMSSGSDAAYRLLVQLDETACRFEGYWSGYERRLRRWLQLRRFDHGFRECQVSVRECQVSARECQSVRVSESVRESVRVCQESARWVSESVR